MSEQATPPEDEARDDESAQPEHDDDRRPDAAYSRAKDGFRPGWIGPFRIADYVSIRRGVPGFFMR